MTVSPMENQLAVCSWSLRPRNTADLIGQLEALNLPRVQLGLNDHRSSAGGAAVGAELADTGIKIVSGMFGAVGEDYTTLETIRQTGGVAPDETWATNWALVQEVAAAAEALGLNLVTMHAGFLPEEPSHPDYGKLKERLRRIAAVFADRGIDLGFETGQEDAPALKHFLDDLAAPNVGVNFDPANMLLYGKGDPVEAVRMLLPYLKQVHIKDAVETDTPGTWGTEMVVGTGQVDWPAFLGVLSEAGFDAPMCIEREGGENRFEDIRAAQDHVAKVLREGRAG